ncbi:PIG-L deacetylase family protein [Candidatus Ruminimicrobiellum ovillum]|uniref:PIG-L deacetylase family protein n=1 Tax=Candidatus Ruminimicrobiellum ovillum TaxID=1947927 RepID=UPI00355A4EF3
MKYASYRSVFRMYEYIQPFLKYSIPLEEELPGKKMLVIAPHQDDESIGCGGTLIKHTKAGGKLEIAFCTSGGEKRLYEAKDAAKLLGSRRNHFLQFDIRSLYKNTSLLAERLTELFNRVEPDMVFLPFMIDNHQDHVAISRAFSKAYKNKAINCLVYAYSVWTTLIPNVVVDISEHWEQKRQAIDCYKTQTATRDYVTMAESISKYWSVVKGKNTKYCEAFFKATSAEYVSLVKKIL